MESFHKLAISWRWIRATNGFVVGEFLHHTFTFQFHVSLLRTYTIYLVAWLTHAEVSRFPFPGLKREKENSFLF